MDTEQLNYIVHLLQKAREIGVTPNRTQLHKISYFVQDSAEDEAPFKFVLHNYGPYSFELDQALQELTDSNDVDVAYDSDGYGAFYRLANDELLDEVPGVSEETDRELGRWVDAFSRMQSWELELYATALYVLRERPDSSRSEHNQAVRNIKPHFSEAQVSDAFTWLEDEGLVQEVA